MIGVQISLNGKPLYTVGGGDFGAMLAGVDWSRTATRKGPIVEHLWVGARFYPGSGVEDFQFWQNHALQVGDEISMKIVETDTPDQPLPGQPDYPHSISN